MRDFHERCRKCGAAPREYCRHTTKGFPKRKEEKIQAALKRQAERLQRFKEQKELDQ